MKVAREVRIGLCRKLVTCDYISFVLSRWEAYFAFEPTFAASVFSWNGATIAAMLLGGGENPGI